MSDETIDKGAWATFFDQLSPALAEKQARIQVESLAVGDQVAADWKPIIGISYDAKDDAFSVSVPGLDHVIRGPTSLAVRRRGTTVESLAVRDGQDALHVIQFRDLVHLPPQ
jgi:hypothetical protein